MQTGNRTLRLALVPALLLACAATSADTYKWTDAEGKVHYSDQPPPTSVKEAATVGPKKKTSVSGANAKAEEAAQSDAKPATEATKPAPARPKTVQEQDAEFKQRQVKAAEKEAEDKKKAAEASEKKQNCERARANVSQYEAGGRISRRNNSGETEFLDDQQIAEELARARKAADSWCK